MVCCLPTYRLPENRETGFSLRLCRAGQPSILLRGDDRSANREGHGRRSRLVDGENVSRFAFVVVDKGAPRLESMKRWYVAPRDQERFAIPCANPLRTIIDSAKAARLLCARSNELLLRSRDAIQFR